jgi:hypothetical protein
VVPGLPSISELSALGITRTSSAPARSSSPTPPITAATHDLLRSGTYPPPAPGALAYGDASGLMAP